MAGLVQCREPDDRIARREVQLREELPGLFAAGGTCLYIGANEEMHTALEGLHQAGYRIAVLEVWPEYVRQLLTGPLAEWVDTVIEGDVRDAGSLPLADSYDVAFWFHGPEHVLREECEPVLAMLEAKARRLVVLGSPNGNTMGRGPNPYAHHVSCYYLADFQRLGYEARAIGQMDAHGGHILAWKWLA